MSLLDATGLTASYGASKALFGVDLAVEAGEVVALMGRNGMGKTTTVKAICRMIASEGRLEFAGHDLHALPSHRVARLGVGLVPEGRRCFRDLTVTENLLAAARPGPWDRARVMALFPALGRRPDQRAVSLSGGEQQMLAIGRALMTNPRAPSCHGDHLTFRLKIARIGGSSADYVMTAHCEGELRLTTRATLVHVGAIGRSVPWPEEIRERLSLYKEDAP